MLEVVFDQSLAGAMRQAKGHPRGVTVSQGVKFYMRMDDTEEKTSVGRSEPCRVETIWDGDVLEGTQADVAPLVLALEVGDLSELDTPKTTKRRAVLRELMAPWQNEDTERFLEELHAENQKTLERLREAGANGDPIRIWAAPWCPSDVCGLYYVCHLLNGVEAPVFLVQPPRERLRPDGTMVVYRGLGEVQPRELGGLPSAGLSGVQKRAYASRWLELVKENAPMRAMINGQLMGVPEDFYDFALIRSLSADELKKLGLVIAQTLQQIPGIGDVWLYLRLIKMVERGEAQIERTVRPDHPYSAAIRWCGCFRQL